MNKFCYVLLSAVAFSLASCANEDMVVAGNPDGKANVTINLTTPLIQTRAFSDGQTANKLIYAIYDTTSGNREFVEKYEDDIMLQKVLNVTLLSDHTYEFVFWAESADDEKGNATNPYTVSFTKDAATMTVDYTGIVANNENLDAFFGSIKHTVTGDVQLSVPLKRPFAQVNIGTNDYTAAKKMGFEREKMTSTIKTSTYTQMNLFDGSIPASNTSVPVEFKMSKVPQVGDGDFPVNGYEYLAMTYILVDDDETLEVEFNYAMSEDDVDHSRTVGSVPVKRNHRTNIYGQVITANTALTITITPAFTDPDLEPDGLQLAGLLGGTYTVPESTTYKSNVDFKKDGILNLNENTLTMDDALIVVREGSTLTINGPGEVNRTGNNASLPSSGIYVKDGNIKINDGKFTSNGVEAIIIEKGWVYILGGYFAAGETYEGKYFTLNCIDTNYNAGEAGFVVTGGIFEEFDPANSMAEPKGPVNWVANGYRSVNKQINGKNCYVVVPEDIDPIVTTEDLLDALENGNDVSFFNDIKIDPAGLSSGYGTTGINIKNGQTIDGNGYTLDIAGAKGTWDSGINTTGGTIKNLRVTGSFRGVFINHNSNHSEPVILEKVIIEGTTYTISCDQGNYQTLTATDCVFNGWTSYAATLGDSTFINCSFGEGKGYKFCRPYAPTTFINCDFCEGYEMDPRAAVSFENCRLNGTALTADNLSMLVTANIDNASIK